MYGGYPTLPSRWESRIRPFGWQAASGRLACHFMHGRRGGGRTQYGTRLLGAGLGPGSWSWPWAEMSSSENATMVAWLPQSAASWTDTPPLALLNSGGFQAARNTRDREFPSGVETGLRGCVQHAAARLRQVRVQPRSGAEARCTRAADGNQDTYLGRYWAKPTAVRNIAA